MKKKRFTKEQIIGILREGRSLVILQVILRDCRRFHDRAFAGDMRGQAISLFYA